MKTKKTTKKYVALAGNMRILSVIAESKDEARRRIREQLNRPGRRQYLKRWKDDGEQIRIEAF